MGSELGEYVCGRWGQPGGEKGTQPLQRTIYCPPFWAWLGGIYPQATPDPWTRSGALSWVEWPLSSPYCPCLSHGPSPRPFNSGLHRGSTVLLPCILGLGQLWKSMIHFPIYPRINIQGKWVGLVPAASSCCVSSQPEDGLCS